MPRQQLILHIGPHKTGTTSLQHGLCDLRAWLRDQGIDYPAIGLIHAAHHGVTEAFRSFASATDRAVIAALPHLFDRCDRVVLSSEGLCTLDPAGLRKLLAAVPGGTEIQIVLFNRMPVFLWPSHWQELIRHGEDLTLIDYLVALCGWRPSGIPASRNPVAIAAKFASVFGHPALRIFCYDNMIADGSEILGFFLRAVLGICEAPAALPRHAINPSMAPEFIELLRCLNAVYIAGRGQGGGEIVLQHLLRHREAIEHDPRYLRFAAALAEHADTVVLDSDNELLKARERSLMNRFGDCIENKAAPDQLYLNPKAEQRLSYGERYWTHRFGMAGYVDELFTALQIP